MAMLENELDPLDVPKKFRDHVESVLAEEWMGTECENRLYGKTPFEQHYVFCISKVAYYAVRLIVDEEHRDLPLHRQENVYSDNVVERPTFFTLEAALEYRNEKHAQLSDGIFEGMAFRIRKLPSDCLDYPHKYLFLGDHIQRRLDAAIPLGHHEGVYIGDGKVAHISIAPVISVLPDINEGRAIITSLEHFLVNLDQELGVVVHCFRRKMGQDICKTVRELVNNQHGREQYRVFRQNCQHFASYCVLGEEYMSDKKGLIEKAVRVGAAAMAVAAVRVGLHLFGRNL
uniref:LRAT domain-containing protein n=1 Tax=Panagrolaimus sp. JU765 TaxID=591449 RepID=A0AC34QCF9_9BILA